MKLWELDSVPNKPKTENFEVLQNVNGFARDLKQGWVLEIQPCVDEGWVSMYAYENEKLVDSAEDYGVEYLAQLKRTGAIKLKEDGQVVQGVNTTCDVKPGEIARQAAKFGNHLKSDGTPPDIR